MSQYETNNIKHKHIYFVSRFIFTVCNRYSSVCSQISNGKKVKSDIIHGSFQCLKCVNLTCSPVCMGPDKKKNSLGSGFFLGSGRLLQYNNFFFFFALVHVPTKLIYLVKYYRQFMKMTNLPVNLLFTRTISAIPVVFSSSLSMGARYIFFNHVLR